jgi:hypothetical protein
MHCVLLEDRRTNIKAVHKEDKQVIAERINQQIAELVQPTNNEKVMQDDEKAKNYEKEIGTYSQCTYIRNSEHTLNIHKQRQTRVRTETVPSHLRKKL